MILSDRLSSSNDSLSGPQNWYFVIKLCTLSDFEEPPPKRKRNWTATCIPFDQTLIVMKIIKENAGLLTNFEVLDFLRSRGAAKDPTRVLAPVAPSEFKVYDYLEQSAACSQTKESISKFLTECKPYKLTKTEIISIINIRPTSAVEIDPLIDDLDSRLGESVEELVELVVQVLPPSQAQNESNEVIEE